MNNLEAEAIVLGTLLTDPKAGHFVQMLTVDDFSDQHRLVFEAIAAAAQEGRFASAVVLTPQFKNDRMTADLTIGQYLGRLASMAARREVMPDYIRALKDMSGRRLMGCLAASMVETARSASAPLQQMAEDVVSSMDEMLSGLRRQKVTSFMFDELAQDTIARLRSGVKPNLIDTGLLGLNKDIGGFMRGDLVLLGGRPSMGKTTIALSAMRQAAKRGVSALMFSQEMPHAPVMARLLSDAAFNSITPIPYSKIIRSELPERDIDRLEEISQSLGNLPIRIDEQTGLSVSEMGVRARRYADQLALNGRRLDTIWIDHLGFVKATSRYSGIKVYELGEITKALRALAKELDVAIILLCQLSREVERREDKRPQLSDLRDSGNLEEDADCVLFAYREAYYLGRMSEEDDINKRIERQEKLNILEKIVEISGAKTRNGAIFTRRFFANMGSNTVRDLAA
jgi:replicative DNA helicase